MGVVWLAECRQSKAQVALKTVRSPAAGLLDSLRREIRALAKLSHPGIVAIRDEGIQGAVPWYAMEIIPGLSLRQWLGESPTLPWWTSSLAGPLAGNARQDPESGFSSERLGHSFRSKRSPGEIFRPGESGQDCALGDFQASLTLVRRLCDPLDYLHSHGVVHCDLKPENILLRPDARPVLVDFGLTQHFPAGMNQEVLQVAGLAAGTAAYMAPEQIRGEVCDARTDLYALGCILYELLTGSPPFVGKESGPLLHGHLHDAPPPPSEHRDEIPLALDRLVLKLLEKDPGKRFGYATDLARALGGLGASNGIWPVSSTSLSYLYRPGLSGRDLELRRLRNRLENLERDGGGVILLGGESGIGKTRLLVELAREAKKSGFRVVVSEATVERKGPLQLLRPALRAVVDICLQEGPEMTGFLLAKHGGRLAAYEPALSKLPGQAKSIDLSSLPVADAQARLYRDLTKTLDAFAATNPTLLILDDLQWADDLSLSFLQHYAQTSDCGPLLVLGAYRSEELGSSLSPVLAEILAGSGAERMELVRLLPPDVAGISPTCWR